MHDLLADILAAHGGIDRWRGFDTLTAHLVAADPSGDSKRGRTC
jgi:hypothetical protein